MKTAFESINNEDVIDKTYLGEERLKNGHLSLLEKSCNEFKIQNKKQFVEEVLNQRIVKLTIQILYDTTLFDIFENSDEVLKDFSFVTKRDS